MKKILSVLLALCMIAGLATPCFAKEVGRVTGVYVTKLQTPVAGQKIPEKPESAVKVRVEADLTEGGKKEIGCIAHAAWSETESPDKALGAGKSFVAGKSYRFTLTLDLSPDFMEEVPKADADTKYQINGENATGKTSGQNLIVYADYVAAVSDLTPKVTLKTEGQKAKTYDGKAVTLIAQVEKTEGIEYRYEWYFEGKVLEGETEDALVRKDVAHSGEYYCKVSAFLPSQKNEQKSAKSASETLSITPCSVTVDIQDAEKNLQDPDPEFTYELLGEPYDEMKGELSREEGEEIGKYKITLGTLAFDPEVADNYKVRVQEGILSIIDAGTLPFVAVPGVADQSYITGKGGAKIRVSATKGAIPEDAILSLSIPEGDAKKDLEESEGKKVLKCFALSLMDKDGKKISLPKHASIRLQIPLTEEEEETFDPATITAVLYDKTVAALDTEVVKSGSNTYLSVKIDSQGTVALFEGKTLAPATTSTAKGDTPKETDGSVLVWIIIVILMLAACGVIVFVILQNRKTSGEGQPKVKKALTPEEQAAKEKARRIAEAINAMPPVPEEKKNEEPKEAGMQTRVIPPAPKTPPVVDQKEETRKISFDELEE